MMKQISQLSVAEITEVIEHGMRVKGLLPKKHKVAQIAVYLDRGSWTAMDVTIEPEKK